MMTTLLIVVQQTRTSQVSARLATDSRRQIMLGTEILDTLSEIDRRSRAGESAIWETSQFRQLIRSYSNAMTDSETDDLIKRLKFHFNVYVDALPGADPISGTNRSRAQVHSYYQDVSKDVDGLIELNADSTFRTLHEINRQQQMTSRTAIYFLGGFVFLSIIAGYLLITAVTRPLSSLVGFLDRVNIEDDFSIATPHLRSNVPEFSLVAKSFEQVLQRLRGYRALNVRRLLIEKRRADIIAASISDGIFLLRGDDLLYLNPVAEGILAANRNLLGDNGVTPLDLNLRSLAEARPGKEDKGNRCARAILSAIGQSMPVEIEVERGDRKSHYLIQAYPISYDLIEQVEHAVKGPLEELMDRFQANMIVVAQDVTLIRESQEAKGHFLATLSHEIKTPVTSLTMATRLLSKKIEEIPNPSHRSLILTCVEDVDRLRRLLEDLLTISRFDAMIQKLEFQSIDLVKLLKNSVQSFQMQARQKDIDLKFQAINHSSSKPEERNLPLKTIVVSMDPSKVAWAVSNLLTNALRHTPRGGHVDAQVIYSSEEWVEVRVKDTGPGIEHKRQNRIFDKFSPFYDIRVARSGSTGAGLSIAREIVSAHGGRIWVSSEPGRGAEFGFTLPLKRKSTDSGPASGGTGKTDANSPRTDLPGRHAEMKGPHALQMEMFFSTSFMKGAVSGATACS